jgi:hypothetical protein
MILGTLTTSKVYPSRFGNTSQASAKGHREPSTISQPIRRNKSVGGSILNISIAKAWASFAVETNASMSTLLKLALVFGSPQNSIETVDFDRYPQNGTSTAGVVVLQGP